MKNLAKILKSPWAHLFIGIVVFISGLSEAWETLGEDMRSFRLGGHHGVGLLGLFTALKAIAEVIEGMEKIEES